MITIQLFPLLVGAVQLLATYRQIARMSLFPEGCLVADTDQPAPYSVVTTPVENVIDTTSAGDSFNGGFLATYLSGGNIKQACMNGNTLAGTVIQHKGAIIPQAATDAAIAQFKK